MFGREKSLLAASLSSQRMCGYVGVELEMAREAERSLLQFLGPCSLCGLRFVKGLWFPSTYSSLPKQNSLHIFLLFPEFFIPLLNTCLVLLNTFFSMMCTMWLKTQLFPSLPFLVVSWEWNGQVRSVFPLCLVCWLLLCSVRCLEQSWLMNFSQEHQFCAPTVNK